jgi:lysyl-tRNA synthetase, class I
METQFSFCYTLVMFWCDRIAAEVNGPQVINDSKTPSGRVHVGALRGVLIHDAIFKAIIKRGLDVRYLYGVDDFDPLDELPAGQAEHFQKYLGAPLSNVPPPPGSAASDMATHYISEFFDVFKQLGVAPEIYRMRDIYRSGRFDSAIDQILTKADIVRRVYYEVSGAKRPANWFPFQVICENCGRIGTTEVTEYDGKLVTYSCREDLVKWAKGCGHRGRTSPFSGGGKLPWKLEWVAKWREFPVTIEGAGKDHSTRGGSRDVAAQCLEQLFGLRPPLNVPYEFFLVGGAKMSSSRGVGASARDMADLLPPELLRFLMLRTPPARTVNFSPDQEGIVRLFAEYDRIFTRVVQNTAQNDERRVLALSQVGALDESVRFLPEFDIILILLQMPHVDLEAEIEKRKGDPLTSGERRILQSRVQSARCWLERFATDDQKLVVRQSLPAEASKLSNTQRAFLHKLAELLTRDAKEPEAVQAAIFDAARLTPIAQPEAFKALYRIFLDREAGPKAGHLLAYLDRDFVRRRLLEVTFNEYEYYQESSITPEEFENYLEANRSEISKIVCSERYISMEMDLEGPRSETSIVALGFLHFFIHMLNGQVHCRRVRFMRTKGVGSSSKIEYEYFQAYAREFVHELADRSRVMFSVEP